MGIEEHLEFKAERIKQNKENERLQSLTAEKQQQRRLNKLNNILIIRRFILVVILLCICIFGGKYFMAAIISSNQQSESAPLSIEEAAAIIKMNDFYDGSKNNNGKGFNNQFEIIIRMRILVIDHASGLMWQQGGSSNDMPFKNAKKYI